MNARVKERERKRRKGRKERQTKLEKRSKKPLNLKHKTVSRQESSTWRAVLTSRVKSRYLTRLQPNPLEF